MLTSINIKYNIISHFTKSLKLSFNNNQLFNNYQYKKLKLNYQFTNYSSLSNCNNNRIIKSSFKLYNSIFSRLFNTSSTTSTNKSNLSKQYIKIMISKLTKLIYDILLDCQNNKVLPIFRLEKFELYPLKNTNRGDYFTPILHSINKKNNDDIHEITNDLNINNNVENINKADKINKKRNSALISYTHNEKLEEYSKIVLNMIEKKLSASDLASLISVYAENGFINFKINSRELASEVRPPSDSSTEVAATSFNLIPIGNLSTVFPEKHGIPRQGARAPTTRAYLTLSGLNSFAFEGMDEYSHAWIVFIFHAASSVAKTKIRAPRLGGKKVGVFATRSPHRANPIGLSLVKIDKIDGNRIWFSGIDLLDGTPVLDIKPYHPADNIPATYPEWVQVSDYTVKVTWNDSSKSELQGLVSNKKLKFYNKDEFDMISKAIEDCLGTDVRSNHSKRTHNNGIYAFAIDRLQIVFRMLSQNKLEIVKVEYISPDAPQEQSRTNAWLRRIASELNLEIDPKYLELENDVQSDDDEKNDERTL